MSPFDPPEARASRSLIARVREDFGHKAIGAVVALVFEGLLLLVLLALGQRTELRKEAPMATVTFDAREESEKPAPEPEQKAAATLPRAMTAASPSAPQPVVAPPPPPAAVIPVSPQQMQSFDISNLAKPAAPKAQAYGPAFSPAFGDSKRVGTAPNGQPMYAASWYREPTDQELRGYLSTAQGPGWGLITCKTVPDFRVEDCVGLDEYPEGSNMLRAILAAAWQFRVRPPQVGGVSQVGDWVRIRIEYTEEPANRFGDSSKN